MGAVYRRQGSRYYWLKFHDSQGREQRRSSETADEEAARSLLAEIESQEKAKAPRANLESLTVQVWYEDTWLPQRRVEQPSAWRTDSSRLRHHFLSKFGGWSMADMGTERGEQAVLDWLVGLRSHTARRDGQPIASRTAWSTWSIVKVFFADARERRVIARSPCDGLRPRKHLPVKVDKMKGFRETAGFTLEQVVALTSDQRVPLDRRVYYGLGFLGGGLRPSSRAIARWKDLDRTKVPLWRLSITGAYDSANRLEKQRTKTGATYHVPVHPVLQAMLETWWSEGWEAFIGRPPRPDDFIVPRQDGQPRRVDFTLEQFHGDLDRLGMPRQRQYESRATFRTLALDGGADSAQVDAITHPSLVIGTDFYRRLEREWRARCAAVLGIDPGAWRPPADASKETRPESDNTASADQKGAESVPVPVAGYSPGDSVLRVGPAESGIPKEEPRQVDETWRGEMVTRTGIEPMFST